ncbi:cytochrome P450 [Bradyrhizobium sp. CB1650]|uniref:cytochrome P450 n=1 Tax=Bradyrhizobium sp. CB1650 TaxID=3039153 RepID=UPI002435D85C|nr:cytochrome P450 [Bradyrhizobium sp. CB1650]WGD50062.1 cytochrome P450 [Bradyrhizobium sp. CB1650]
MEGYLPISHDDIIDPVLYSDEGRLHRMLSELRHTDPVRWTEPSNYRPFWALTKHADVMEVERQSSQFIVGPRNRLVTVEEEERVKAKTGGKPLMRTLPTMDDPDHRKYRNVSRRWFQPGSLQALELQLASLSKEYVDLMEAANGEIDFVRQVSVWFPLRVIMLILGLPEQDAEMMHRLTSQLFSPHDPDTARQTDGHAIAEAGAELFAYYRDVLEERRKNPRGDLASEIANATVDDAPINDHEALSYFVSITAAGHETTAGAIAGGIHALSASPDQYKLLRSNPNLLAKAVEEILRYVSPVRSFMRVAVNDYELRGQRIRGGQSVLMIYPSANRDEEVFEDPHAFNIERSSNEHIAFGFGPHVCIGLALARLEMKHFLKEFVTRINHVELAQPTIWVKNNFLGGPKRMKVSCTFAN